MNHIERLKQYLSKATFDSVSDRHSAMDCIAEIERSRRTLIESIEDAAEEWAIYVEVDTAPITLPNHIRAAIAKAEGGAV